MEGTDCGQFYLLFPAERLAPLCTDLVALHSSLCFSHTGLVRGHRTTTWLVFYSCPVTDAALSSCSLIFLFSSRSQNSFTLPSPRSKPATLPFGRNLYVEALALVTAFWTNYCYKIMELTLKCRNPRVSLKDSQSLKSCLM